MRAPPSSPAAPMSHAEEAAPEPREDVGLVTIATYSAAAEAELARGRLASAGFVATLADHFIVGVNGLLAPAVGGVKLRVPAEEASRARTVLEESVSRRGPVFRVRATRAEVFALVGIGIGVLLGMGALLAHGSPVPAVALVVLGAATGSRWGARRRADFCSAPECGAPLEEVDLCCPRCGGRLMGTIANRNDRLAAEESLLPGPTRTPLP